jgi:hypothetical protein
MNDPKTLSAERVADVGSSGVVRRLQIYGQPAVCLADDKAVTAHLSQVQPKWRERDSRSKRVHLGGWFRNQGERSRLIIRNGGIVGRIDCVSPNDKLRDAGESGVEQH